MAHFLSDWIFLLYMAASASLLNYSKVGNTKWTANIYRLDMTETDQSYSENYVKQIKIHKEETEWVWETDRERIEFHLE